MTTYTVIGNSHAVAAAKAASAVLKRRNAKVITLPPLQNIPNSNAVFAGEAAAWAVQGRRDIPVAASFQGDEAVLIISGTDLAGHITVFPTISASWSATDSDRRISLPRIVFDPMLEDKPNNPPEELMISEPCFRDVYISEFTGRSRRLRRSAFFNSFDRVYWIASPPPAASLLSYFPKSDMPTARALFASRAFFRSHYLVWQRLVQPVFAEANPVVKTIFPDETVLDSDGFIDDRHLLRADDPVHANPGYYKNLLEPVLEEKVMMA